MTTIIRNLRAPKENENEKVVELKDMKDDDFVRSVMRIAKKDKKIQFRAGMTAFCGNKKESGGSKDKEEILNNWKGAKLASFIHDHIGLSTELAERFCTLAGDNRKEFRLFNEEKRASEVMKNLCKF